MPATRRIVALEPITDWPGRRGPITIAKGAEAEVHPGDANRLVAAGKARRSST